METQKKPQFLGCLIATLVGFVLSVIVVILLLYSVRPLLILPATLGLIKPLLPEEVLRASIPGTTQLELGEARHYFIFTQRRVLVTDYKLRLESLNTGTLVELRPAGQTIQYDTETIKGVLLYHFTIDQPGTYRLIVVEAQTPETLLIAPDYTGRNQTVVLLFFSLLVFLVGIGAWLYWRRGNRPDPAKAQTKRDRWEAWMGNDG